MKARLSRRNFSGFTLIELVISASLMALILGSAYLCLSSGISSQKLIESRGDVIQGARVAMAMISADLRAACPLSRDIQFLGMHRILDDLEADNMDFGTHHYTPRHAREADLCQVSYFLAKDPESRQYALWRRRNPTLGLDPLSGGATAEIAGGLRGLKFEYSDGFDWYDQWGDPNGRRKGETSWRDQPNLFGMPEAVRITIWFAPDSKSSTPAAKENVGEPPLVFQTVARLNLAATSQPSTSSAGASGENATREPKPAPPAGGIE